MSGSLIAVPSTVRIEAMASDGIYSGISISIKLKLRSCSKVVLCDELQYAHDSSICQTPCLTKASPTYTNPKQLKLMNNPL